MKNNQQQKTIPTNYVDIPLEPKNYIDRLLIKWKIKNQVVRYPLRTILQSNRVRIAEKAVKLPKDFFKDNEGLFAAALDNSLIINDDLIYIVAVAIQNNRNEPSKKLLNRLKWLDDTTFYTVFDEALSMLDLQSFLKCIALIIGTEPLIKPNKS